MIFSNSSITSSTVSVLSDEVNVKVYANDFLSDISYTSNKVILVSSFPPLFLITFIILSLVIFLSTIKATSFLILGYLLYSLYVNLDTLYLLNLVKFISNT